MKVSYIVPVYKVEQYLSQCVESLLAQTYTDFEILLVDDGSPDGCPALCDQWAKKDSRIHSLHKKNGGLSDARNFGLQNAKGDYVVFIDGDDFWTDNSSLDKLVTILNNNPELDFLGFNCQYYFQEDNNYRKWSLFPKSVEKPIDNNTALVALAKAGYFAVSACMKIIKRHFLIDNHIYFKVGQLSEDIPWFINLMDATTMCMFTNEYVYSYRQISNGGSITHNIGLRNFDTLTDIIDREIDYLDNRSFNKMANNALCSFLAYELILSYAFLQYLDRTDARSRFKKLKKLNWLLSYTQNPKVKIVSQLNRILGTRVTVKIIQLYLKHIRR